MSSEYVPHSELSFAYTETLEKRLQQPIRVVTLERESGQISKKKSMLSPDRAIVKNIAPLLRSNCPHVIVGIPHSGTVVPEDLYRRMSAAGKRQLFQIDAGTNRIGNFSEFPSVCSLWNKHVSNLNRAPLGNKPRAAENHQPNIRKSMTAIVNPFEKTKGQFRPAFRVGQEPTIEEVQQLAEITYVPYYHEAMGLMASITDRMQHGKDRALFIDLHSFPPGQTKHDLSAEELLGTSSLDYFSLFNLGWQNDYGQVSCDTDIVMSLRQSIIHEFRKLPADVQEKLTGKKLFKITDKDIVDIGSSLQGTQNAEFWGDLGQEKRPTSETTPDEWEEMNERLSQFRKKTGVNMIQIEMKETYRDYPVAATNHPIVKLDYDAALVNEGLEETIQKILKAALFNVDEQMLKKRSNAFDDSEQN